MKPNFTSINVIVDESGSMHSLKSETISGLNKFIEEQKLVPGEASFTLCFFNTSNRLRYQSVDLNAVESLSVYDYGPAGSTALLDAIGVTIDDVGAKLASMNEEDRPSKVLFLVITDGQENASKKFSRSKIKEMILHQETKYNWCFTFSGANIDAISEGASMGFSGANVLNYVADSAGTSNLYRGISESTTRFRSQILPNAPFFDKK